MATLCFEGSNYLPNSDPTLESELTWKINKAAANKPIVQGASSNRESHGNSTVSGIHHEEVVSYAPALYPIIPIVSSNRESPEDTTVSRAQCHHVETPANAPANDPTLQHQQAILQLQHAQQSTIAPSTSDQQASAEVRGTVVDGDMDPKDACRKNPGMQLFIQRHPDPTVRAKAVHRDMIARRTLGDLYHQHNQSSYNVLEKRAKLTQDLDTRAEELSDG